MRNFFSWIWDEVFSSSTGYLTISLAAFAGISFFSSIYLYQALQTATLEKEQALAQIVTLEKNLAILGIAKDADNTAARIIIHQNDIWNDLNTNVALEIAEIPKIEWTSSIKKTLDTNEQYSEQVKETSDTKKNNRLSNHFVEQKRQYNETTACNIDTPLPRLSAPLIMLYNEVSRSHTPSASFMAHGNKTSTRSASQRDERPSVGAVGTRASYNLRPI